MAVDDIETPFYGEAQRARQDEFGTRPLADTHEAVIVTETITAEQKEFIEGRDFFFLASVGDDGFPSVSYKGGPVGVVRVEDEHTLVFPSYDGNGMYLTLGNIDALARIGLLFIDMERPDRLRVQAEATVVTGDELAADPAAAWFPGAEAIVRARVARAWVNCARYIHRHTRVSSSPSVPDAAGDAPFATWKRIDLLQDVLPEQDQGRAEEAGGTITADDYAERLADGTT